MKVKKIVLVIVILSAIGYLIISGVSDGYYMPMMYDYNYSGFSGSYNYWRGIALFGLVVASLLLFLVSFKPKSNNNSQNILDYRLSKGELSIEEYKRLTKVLGGNR